MFYIIYMEGILNKLKESVNDNSFKQYTRMYNTLKIKSIADLKDVKSIDEKLKDRSNNTKKNYYASIVKLLRFTDEKELIEEYVKLMKEFIDKTKPSEEYNDKQRKNLMTREQIEVIRKNLIKGITDFYSRLNYDILLDYVVLSLYTLQPPRRNEYWTMKITTNADDVNDKDNYVLWTPKRKQFIFQDYKTSNKYGREVVDINKELQEVITLYLKYRSKFALKDNDNFLVKYGNLNFDNSNDITRRLNRVLGKKIGASMLRHIYLSEKYGKVINEMEKDAELMAHSTTMQKEYIKK